MHPFDKLPSGRIAIEVDSNIWAIKVLFMEFRIADTFTAGLAKLTGDEQKAVKIAAFDFLLNPANPRLQFHKLDKVRDHGFWSIRASHDVRLIIHRTENSMLLCYVGHHDAAYDWARRRKVETHPTTGAVPSVEVRDDAGDHHSQICSGEGGSVGEAAGWRHCSFQP